MKKKVIGIIIVVALVIGGAGIYYFTHRGGSVGISNTIQNADNKKAELSKYKDKKVLVLYFSESGNTQKFAKIISDEAGGDFRRIETVKAYPKGNKLFDYTEKEKDQDARPQLKDLSIHMDDYDVVFIGYPIWWYTLPMPLYSFFDQYDLSGKTIIPFNTHEGSGDGGTYETIKDLEPKASVLEGLPIRGGDMKKDQSDKIIQWLNKLKV